MTNILRHNHRRRNHKDHFHWITSDIAPEDSTTATASAPTASNTPKKGWIWKKVLENQPGSVIDQLCTCIESQETVTVTAKRCVTSYKPDISSTSSVYITTTAPVEFETTTPSSTDPSSIDSSDIDSATDDSSNTYTSTADIATTDHSATYPSSTSSSSVDTPTTDALDAPAIVVSNPNSINVRSID